MPVMWPLLRVGEGVLIGDFQIGLGDGVVDVSGHSGSPPSGPGKEGRRRALEVLRRPLGRGRHRVSVGVRQSSPASFMKAMCAS